MVHWAEQIGPHTARLFERILADKPHPEMGYRSCLGIIRLAEQEGRALRHPVVLMHNQPAGNPATVSALPVIIRFFRAHGYRFVRV